MASETISFRVNTETYLKLEALASEKGTSVGLYLKDKIEDEANQLTTDVKMMQSDLSDIIAMLTDLKQENKQTNSLEVSPQPNINNSALIEILMILREIAQPGKLSSAQKKVSALGLEIFKTWKK